MNFKKIFLIIEITELMSNTVLAVQGDISIIPKLKVRTEEIEIVNNLEIGISLGVDNNAFGEDYSSFTLNEDEFDDLDFTSYNISGVVRYNFPNIIEVRP
jgi:hypothetical protein